MRCDTYVNSEMVGFKLASGFHILNGLEDSLIMVEEGVDSVVGENTEITIKPLKPELYHSQDDPIEMYRGY